MPLAQVELDAERDAPGDEPPRRPSAPGAATPAPSDGEAERRQARPLSPLADLVDRRPVSHGIATVMPMATAASSR